MTEKGTVTVTRDMICDGLRIRFPEFADRIDDEIIDHLATEAAELVASGYSEAIDMVIMEWAREKLHDKH